jgi:4-hydroxy-L-threonine phosphate dehydrogenase PdxA
MMLAGDKLRVVLVTIHCALKAVPETAEPGRGLQHHSHDGQASRKTWGFQAPGWR